MPRIASGLRCDDDYRVADGEVTLTRAGEVTVVELLGADAPPPSRRREVMREVEWLVGVSSRRRRDRDYLVWHLGRGDGWVGRRLTRA